MTKKIKGPDIEDFLHVCNTKQIPTNKYFVGNSLFLAIFEKTKFSNILYYSGMTGFGGNTGGNSKLVVKFLG